MIERSETPTSISAFAYLVGSGYAPKASRPVMSRPTIRMWMS